MLLPGRQYGTKGRYLFNGKEQAPEVKGAGAQYDYGFRIYDPRLGRFLSVDPLANSYPWNSTYAFAENDVIRCIDLDGLEKYYVINYWKNGVKQRTEIEAYRDVDSKNIINMQFKLSGAPLTDKDKDVVIYDVYDEGTKKERISQSDAPELSAEQAKIFTKVFTVEKIVSGTATIENDLDNDVTDGEVSSTKGLLHLQAAKNYIDKSKSGGKSIPDVKTSRISNSISMIPSGSGTGISNRPKYATDKIIAPQINSIIAEINTKSATIKQIDITITLTTLPSNSKTINEIKKNILANFPKAIVDIKLDVNFVPTPAPGQKASSEDFGYKIVGNGYKNK